MEQKIKLEVFEIEALKNIQDELNNITLELGTIEVQFETLKEIKTQTLIKLGNFKTKQQQLGNELNKKYGTGTIDLTSGEFTKSS